MADPVLLVAGLGRCGTTMLMTMLDAGGFPVAGPRPAYELSERFWAGGFDRAWLSAQRGCAVKLIDPSRYVLRDSDFSAPPVTILMERRAAQQSRSQVKLLNIGLDGALGRKTERALRRSIEADSPRLRAKMGHLGFVYRVQFEKVLADPASAADRLARIVRHHWGRSLNTSGASAAVIARDPRCLPDLTMEAAVLPAIARDLDARDAA